VTADDPSRRGSRGVADATVAIAAASLVLFAWTADRPWWETHVLPLSCATRPWQLHAFGAVRVAALVGAATLVAVVRPKLRGDLVGAVARTGIAAVLAVGVAALALGSRGSGARVPPEVPAIRPDEHLGRVLEPSRTGEVQRGGRTIRFAVNALGLRARTEDDLPDRARPSILVVGESIAQGYAVPYEESPPYLVEQATGVPTIDAAVSAYASDQAYRRMTEVLALFERPLAVVTFVVPLQVQRSVERWREHLAVGPGGALEVVSPDHGLLRSLRLFEVLDRVGPHTREALDVTRAIVAATARDARGRGAFPLFVATNFREPCLHDASGESSLAHQLFEGLDVPYVSVDLDPAWGVPGDGHPDVRGSRALADAIVAKLRGAHVL
jgi:hypothetical protein